MHLRIHVEWAWLSHENRSLKRWGRRDTFYQKQTLFLFFKVREVIEGQKAELIERRYSFPIGKLMGVVRESLKWADGKLVKEITDSEVRGGSAGVWDV